LPHRLDTLDVQVRSAEPGGEIAQWHLEADGIGRAGSDLCSPEVCGLPQWYRLLRVVAAEYQGALPGMLGEGMNWVVANVRATGGHAVLRHGGREAVLLEDVAPADRIPILRR
jgi:hypothetical protein